jgi:hypothetical protein
VTPQEVRRHIRFYLLRHMVKDFLFRIGLAGA